MNEFFSNLKDDFIQSFVEGDRWLLYLKGVGVTLEVAAVALILGIILGVLVAVVRTTHDQQRPRQEKSCYRCTEFHLPNIYDRDSRYPDYGTIAYHVFRHLCQHSKSNWRSDADLWH